MVEVFAFCVASGPDVGIGTGCGSSERMFPFPGGGNVG